MREIHRYEARVLPYAYILQIPVLDYLYILYNALRVIVPPGCKRNPRTVSTPGSI